MKKFLKAFVMTVCAGVLCAASTDIGISPEQRDDALRRLDNALEERNNFITARQNHIDSMTVRLSLVSPAQRRNLLMEIGRAYTSFVNDSAIAYFTLGEHEAASPDEALAFRLHKISNLPLAGLFDTAIQNYESIDPDSVPDTLKEMYYEHGRRMYSYVASFHSTYTPLAKLYNAKALDRQQHLLGLLEPDSEAHKFNLGEYYFLTGEDSEARAYLSDVLHSKDSSGKYSARAAHHLSKLALKDNELDAYDYYLALSAIDDVRSATLEVIALQELGADMYRSGDIDRAHAYLSTALENAVKCGATLRMIESSRSLPIIERAHSDQLKSRSKTLMWVLGVIVLLMIGLVTMIALLYRQYMRMKLLHEGLRQANRTKEVYISQFLNLCSIYMDKLNQFCKIANRKISTGKVDDLYRMTKSGKFVDEQSREFYEVFDNAFLHLYPDFVSEVNKLLRDDSKIVLKDGELLNTELRILAFTRLGIEDSTRIAQVLNYSLNTIYAYRNRLKARATDRTNFEANVMKIASED